MTKKKKVQEQAKVDSMMTLAAVDRNATDESSAVVALREKLLEAAPTASVERKNLAFDIAIDSTAIECVATVGEGDTVILQKSIVVPSYDGKKAFQITDPKAIEGYNRISYLRTLQRVSGFAIPCELHRIAREGSYKVSKDIDTIQTYARVFFGYSKTTCNQYIRVVDYFLDYGVDDNGKSYYSVKSPFNFHISLTMGHFIEMLAYIPTATDEDGKSPVQMGIVDFYKMLLSSNITFDCSTSQLRKQLSEAFGKGVVDAKKEPEEVKGTGNSGDGENGSNGADDGSQSTMSVHELAVHEVRNAINTISVKNSIGIFTDAERVTALIAELLTLISE